MSLLFIYISKMLMMLTMALPLVALIVVVGVVNLLFINILEFFVKIIFV